MRAIFRVIAVVLVVTVIAGAYVVYRTVWATPLTFDMLLDRQAAVYALGHPEAMTQIGAIDGTLLDFHSGTLDAYSPRDRARDYGLMRRFEAEIRHWDRARLTGAEQRSYDIALWIYESRLASARYDWLGADGSLYPVNPAFGLQKRLPEFLLSIHRIDNALLARRYVERLRALGPVLDAVAADVARQSALGVTPPDFIIDGSIAQMQALISPPPAHNVLLTHLRERTAALGLDANLRARLAGDAEEALRDSVYPAYRRLMAEEHALRAKASHDAGVWRLTDGNRYYADRLRLLTTTDLTADDIHAYGLAEVARISHEADAELRSVGLDRGSVGDRLGRLMADPRFLYSDDARGRARMLVHYGELIGRARALLPRYFATLPKTALDMRRIPEFAETGSAGLSYAPPSLDGARPGLVFANLRDVAAVPMWAMPARVYHEGVPGLHLQTALAVEQSGLPLIRRYLFQPAFSGGWALYAERLAGEMGLYEGDPYGDLGRLQAELFHAARVVVDTGMHARHWSREQAIDYMQSVTGMTRAEVAAEVDRVVVSPGETCASMIGMKVMLDLRREAMDRLGQRFDLRTFHTVLLENGAMPLWLLRHNVDAWIAELQRQPGGAAHSH